VFRIDGEIIPQTDFPALSQKDLEQFFEVIATQEQRDTSTENWNLILPIVFPDWQDFVLVY